MNDDEVPVVRVWDERTGYRTCSVCGTDCAPEPVGSESLGVRIAFTCPEHGVNSIVDPFEGRR